MEIVKTNKTLNLNFWYILVYIKFQEPFKNSVKKITERQWKGPHTYGGCLHTS